MLYELFQLFSMRWFRVHDRHTILIELHAMVANKKQVANYCFYTHTHTFCEYQTLPRSRSIQWSMWAVMTHHYYFGTRPLTIHRMYGTKCSNKQYTCIKFTCSWSKCHQRPKLTTWLVGMLECWIGWNAGNATHVMLEQKSVLFQHHPHNTRDTTLAPAS